MCVYVQTSYIAGEEKKSSAPGESHSFGRKEGMGYSEGIPSLWLQDKPFFLPSSFGPLPERGMAKLAGYPWWLSSSQSNPGYSRFHSPGKKAKSCSIRSRNNLPFRRAISDNFSSELYWELVKKIKTQQFSRPQTNSKDRTHLSYRSRWQLLLKRSLSENGYYRYHYFHSYE